MTELKKYIEEKIAINKAQYTELMQASNTDMYKLAEVNGESKALHLLLGYVSAELEREQA